MTEKSIFTKIIGGEIPSHKIYENDTVLAFLDIHPIQPGHTLVVPKVQVDNIWELSDEDYDALMKNCKKVAIHIQKTLNKRVGSQIIGIDVPHAHVHLIPFSTTDEFRSIPDMNAEPDHAELAKMADKLKFSEE